MHTLILLNTWLKSPQQQKVLFSVRSLPQHVWGQSHTHTHTLKIRTPPSSASDSFKGIKRSHQKVVTMTNQVGEEYWGCHIGYHGCPDCAATTAEPIVQGKPHRYLHQRCPEPWSALKSGGGRGLRKGGEVWFPKSWDHVLTSSMSDCSTGNDLLRIQQQLKK